MSAVVSPRPVVVTAHARVQGCYRFRAAPNADVERQIEDEVRLAWFEGRRDRVKRRPFLLYREKPQQLASGEWFVWSADERRAWIVQAEADGTLVVKTSLSPATAATAEAAA